VVGALHLLAKDVDPELPNTVFEGKVRPLRADLRNNLRVNKNVDTTSTPSSLDDPLPAKIALASNVVNRTTDTPCRHVAWVSSSPHPARNVPSQHAIRVIQRSEHCIM